MFDKRKIQIAILIVLFLLLIVQITTCYSIREIEEGLFDGGDWDW